MRRWLIREAREFPATTAIWTTWIVVFAAMTADHLASGEPLSATRWLFFGFDGGVGFGDLTLDDLARGQFWRLITCNFLHYSLIHLVLNAIAMYQVGSWIESTYGSPQTLFLFGLTGGGGNLVSSAARYGLGLSRVVHSAGGSVAIMGLVGLCAVAGWRAGDAEGRRLFRLMVVFIVLTAALGAAFPQTIDNWGHGGGLIVGLAAGLAHGNLVGRVGKPSASGAGAAMVLLFVGSAVAQYAADRRDSPARLERTLVRRSGYLTRAARELHWLRRSDPPRDHLTIAAKWLKVLDELLDRPGRVEAAAIRPILDEACNGPLPPGRRRELDQHLQLLLDAIRRRYDQDRDRLRDLRGSKRTPGRPSPDVRGDTANANRRLQATEESDRGTHADPSTGPRTDLRAIPDSQPDL